MKCDLVLAGVGGQGVLSMGELIARAARREGLSVKQSEVHGMAQRGGTVQAFLRISDEPIASDLVPQGTADLILSMELLEGLRFLDYLAPTGTFATATDRFLNIPDYPDESEIRHRIEQFPRHILIEAAPLAREAGLLKAVNVVMVGAVLHLLPVQSRTVRDELRRAFIRKGQRIIDINLRALEAGQEATRWVPVP